MNLSLNNEHQSGELFLPTTIEELALLFSSCSAFSPSCPSAFKYAQYKNPDKGEITIFELPSVHHPEAGPPPCTYYPLALMTMAMPSTSDCNHMVLGEGCILYLTILFTYQCLKSIIEIDSASHHVVSLIKNTKELKDALSLSKPAFMSFLLLFFVFYTYSSVIFELAVLL